MRDLGRKHGQPSAVAPAAQLGKHFALLAARQTAHAEAFQHKRTVVRGQQRDNVCPHTRHQPQHKDGGVKLLIKLNGRQVGRPPQEGDKPCITENGSLRVVNA